jgi:hypothetical protein
MRSPVARPVRLIIHAVLAIVSISAAGARSVGAQAVVPTGTRVRVVVPSRGAALRVTGSLVRWSQDTVAVQWRAGRLALDSTLTVPWPDVRETAVSRGRRVSVVGGLAAGVVLGLVGSVAGAYIGDATCRGSTECYNGYGGFMVGGAAGVMTGLVLGLSPHEAWDRAAIPGR